MHVLVLQPDSEMYGACRSLLRTLEAMGARRPRITVVFPYDGPAVQQYREAGIEVVVADLAVLRRSTGRFFGRLRLIGEAKRTARRLAARVADVDVVHSNSMSVLTGIGAKRYFNAPLVWQMREAPTERGLAARGLATLIKRYAASAPAISEASRALVPDATPSPLTPNGYQRPRPVAAFEHRGRPRVGIVGRLIPSKGQDSAVRATALADSAFELVIAGSPYSGHEAYAAGLQQLAADLGVADRVTFESFVDPIEPLLDSLDVLVVATTGGEGFSTIALEALAAGVPVLAAARGGITELVNSDCGALGPVGDPDGIARALDKLLDRVADNGPAMHDAAIRRASEWSPEHSADALLACWNEAVAAGE